MRKKKLEIPHNMGVGTMAWGDEKAGFVSDPTYKPKLGEFNPADLQVLCRVLLLLCSALLCTALLCPGFAWRLFRAFGYCLRSVCCDLV